MSARRPLKRTTRCARGWTVGTVPDLHRVEHAEDVELSLLREIRGVAEQCKGHVHGGEATSGKRASEETRAVAPPRPVLAFADELERHRRRRGAQARGTGRARRSPISSS